MADLSAKLYSVMSSLLRNHSQSNRIRIRTALAQSKNGGRVDYSISDRDAAGVAGKAVAQPLLIPFKCKWNRVLVYVLSLPLRLPLL